MARARALRRSGSALMARHLVGIVRRVYGVGYHQRALMPVSRPERAILCLGETLFSSR